MLNNLLQKFEVLNLREKWLIVTALLVVLWAGWDSVIHHPLSQMQTHLQRDLTNVQAQITTEQRIAAELKKHIQAPPNLDKQKQLNELKLQYQKLQEKILQLDKKFVSPELMAKVLSDLLKQNPQLSLIKLDTQPVALLEVAKQSQQPLYKHGLILQFSGTYLATLKYLQALEAMPWNFVWESVDYQVKNHPQAEITLRIYTLSLKKDWLDV